MKVYITILFLFSNRYVEADISKERERERSLICNTFSSRTNINLHRRKASSYIFFLFLPSNTKRGRRGKLNLYFILFSPGLLIPKDRQRAREELNLSFFFSLFIFFVFLTRVSEERDGSRSKELGELHNAKLICPKLNNSSHLFLTLHKSGSSLRICIVFFFYHKYS